MSRGDGYGEHSKGLAGGGSTGEHSKGGGSIEIRLKGSEVGMNGAGWKQDRSSDI